MTWERELAEHVETLGSRSEAKRTLAADWLNDGWVNGTETQRRAMESAVHRRALELGTKRGGGRALVATLRRPDGFAMPPLAALAASADCDSMVRDTALLALGAMAARWGRVFRWLLALLDHDDPTVRGGAAAGLAQARSAGADLTPAVDRMLDMSKDETLPRSAAYLIGLGLVSFVLTRAPERVDALRHLISEGSLHAVRGAMERLAEAPTQVATTLRDPLASLCKHKNKGLRINATKAYAYALAGLDDEAGFETLAKRKGTRAAAVGALRRAAEHGTKHPWMDRYIG